VTDSLSNLTEPLQSWADLTLKDLVFAYRKAKADCFFERVVSVARAFATYEERLEANLLGLLRRLQTAESRLALVKDPALLGKQILVAKKLSVDPKDKSRKPDGAFFSNKERAYEHLRDHHDLCAELRVAAELPVDFHVISALWVNRVGHRFDASLGTHAYGSRVRRYGDDGRPSKRHYHLKAVGTMPPYFRAYRKWRDDGLTAIRRELKAGEKVICLTLDIRNYFHRIDPSFATSRSFHEKIGLLPSGKKLVGVQESQLTQVDRELTDVVCGLLVAWSEQTRKYIDSHSSETVSTGGIPIGLTAARVLANVLLQPLDRLLVDNLAPIYYGRYVDDMFLVLRDSGSLKSGAEVMDYIARHLPEGALAIVPGGSGGAREKERSIRLGEFQGATELVLQDAKNKVFLLEGNAGLDLLDVIRSEIRDLASERRLLPEAGFLTRKASAQVLTASNDVRERSDTLRRADGLSIRRLGLAIQLRWAETFALDLPPSEWRTEREEFFRFAKNHVLRPERLLDHMDYLPRLLGLAVACEDWKGAYGLTEAAWHAWNELQTVAFGDKGLKLNGYVVAVDTEQVWRQLNQSLGSMMRDAVLRAWPLAHVPAGDLPAEEDDGRAALLGVLERKFPVEPVELEDALGLWYTAADRIQSLAWNDFARRPVKELWREANFPDTPKELDERLGQIVDCFAGDEGDVGAIRRFLARSDECSGRPVAGRTARLRPFLFPTRPLSLREIAEWDPACVGLGDDGVQGDDATRHWGRLARALRGIWTRRDWPRGEARAPAQSGDGSKADRPAAPPPPRLVTIGTDAETPRPTLCIANLETSETAWHAAAAGDPILSLARYEQFARFVNRILAAWPRPDYVLLPELSIPRRWVASLVNRLLDSKISVVAGVEYGHLAGDRVINEAVLALTDDRLGFPSSIIIRQRKVEAAPAEGEELLRLHGKAFVEASQRPVVYRHNGFDFGVLVCSELQDIRLRGMFQGEADCLMVLAWNKDLETFSALVESAALDVHAYVALVNNRRYGDGRVRAPAKEPHLRDVCRIRGGLDDYAVLVRLEVERLRRFQSRAKNWPRGDDPFKPVPQGFDIAPRRWMVPNGQASSGPVPSGDAESKDNSE